MPESCSASGMYFSDRWPNLECLNTSRRQFKACTCGNAWWSVFSVTIGPDAIFVRSPIASLNSGELSLVDASRPANIAGRPADLRVLMVERLFIEVMVFYYNQISLYKFGWPVISYFVKRTKRLFS